VESWLNCSPLRGPEEGETGIFSKRGKLTRHDGKGGSRYQELRTYRPVKGERFLVKTALKRGVVKKRSPDGFEKEKGKTKTTEMSMGTTDSIGSEKKRNVKKGKAAER